MSVPSEMTAAVLHAPGDLRIERAPVPSPADGQVLVKVGACGVCGSDVPRVLTKGTYRFPLIPGHEFAGTVAALGKGVRGFREGEAVAVFPLIPCRKCEMCEGQWYEMCEDYDYLGSRSNGAFAEYVVAPAWNLLKVPKRVSMECAAMAEPAAVALHGLERGGIGPEDSVAIFGAGPIGITLAQWAVAKGASPVFLIDVRADRIEAARKATRATCLEATQTDVLAEICRLTENAGVDIAVEAAGVPVTVPQCIQVTARGGDIVLLGNPSQDVTIPMADVSLILRKQLDVHGTWNSSYRGDNCEDDWTATLEAMAKGHLQLEPLITHRYRIEQANEAFAMMAENREFHNKVMFCFE
ncbi:MAG: galactitol-1-phosphate 5-dehydrogenase [Armatimonadetes bacterium]|nr:galactitol-1-phosphate 5-dehydrogenase [Armatimonadota bacterium]